MQKRITGGYAYLAPRPGEVAKQRTLDAPGGAWPSAPHGQKGSGKRMRPAGVRPARS
jgi:hypothetical protein